MTSLDTQLDQLSEALKARLERRAFAPNQLRQWARLLQTGDKDDRNLLPGRVEHAPPELMVPAPEPGTDAYERSAELGRKALAAGQVAICVLAGGMATRMGGVVKALVDVTDNANFLQLRLRERAALQELHGAPIPFWLMTSEPTHRPIQAALLSADVANAQPFEQFVSLRLNQQGTLFLDDHSTPSVYATGHGDLPDALRRSGHLDRFVAAGGRYVWLSNIDNLGVTVDPAILGQHIRSAQPLTVEVVSKDPGDQGGGPVLHDKQPIIAEHFRLPPTFETERVPVFNTNTFVVNADALANLTLDWTYLEVHKTVGKRTAVQFERLLGEITMALDTRFVHVPRRGPGSRFLPVKTLADLATARSHLASQEG